MTLLLSGHFGYSGADVEEGRDLDLNWDTVLSVQFRWGNGGARELRVHAESLWCLAIDFHRERKRKQVGGCGEKGWWERFSVAMGLSIFWICGNRRTEIERKWWNGMLEFEIRVSDDVENDYFQCMIMKIKAEVN